MKYTILAIVLLLLLNFSMQFLKRTEKTEAIIEAISTAEKKIEVKGIISQPISSNANNVNDHKTLSTHLPLKEKVIIVEILLLSFK